MFFCLYAESVKRSIVVVERVVEKEKGWQNGWHHDLNIISTNLPSPEIISLQRRKMNESVKERETCDDSFPSQLRVMLMRGTKRSHNRLCSRLRRQFYIFPNCYVAFVCFFFLPGFIPLSVLPSLCPRRKISTCLS